jgi:hypothetical protein
MMRESLRPKSKLDSETVRIELRVPGSWKSSGEVIDALNRVSGDYEIGPADSDAEGLFVHKTSGHEFEIWHTEHDDELIEIFKGLQHVPTDEELAEIENHAVKIHLSGKGGSVENARAMMEAATALVRAGGAGVFIDSTTAAHGRTDWLALAEDTEPGGLYWAFIVVGGGEDEVFSTGMHCLGFRDAELPGPITDPNHAGFILHNFLGYVYQSGIEVKDGDALGGEEGPEYRAVYAACTRFLPGAPFFNPFGVYRLEKYDD